MNELTSKVTDETIYNHLKCTAISHLFLIFQKELCCGPSSPFSTIERQKEGNLIHRKGRAANWCNTCQKWKCFSANEQQKEENQWKPFSVKLQMVPRKA
jgi:hypothetical protein